jgi:hypothetical protein
MQPTVNDLLSGASLLLAVVSVLFGLWYADIQKAIDLDMQTVPNHRKDRSDVVSATRTAFWQKAVPLASAAALVALVFLPDAIILCVNAVRTIFDTGLRSALGNYNAVQAAFVAVELITIALAAHSICRVVQLAVVLAKVSSDPPLLTPQKSAAEKRPNQYK